MVPGTASSFLSLFRWDRLDIGREALMRCQIHRPVLHLGARRICSQEVITLPIRRRSDRSRDKSAAAIWTDISQNTFDARDTEGALVGADARLKRIRQQRLIAMLTGRSKFEHRILAVQLPVWTTGSWNLQPLPLVTVPMAVQICTG